MRTGGIIAHHSAQRGPVGGGCVRTKQESHGPQMKIELFLNYPRLDNRPPLLGIRLENAVEILRHVYDDRITDSLSCEASSCTTRKHRDLEIPRSFHRGENILMGSWDNNADGLYFIDTGVGAVHQARGTVKADFATDTGFQRAIKILVHKQFTGSLANPKKRTSHKKAHKTQIFSACLLCLMCLFVA